MACGPNPSDRSRFAKLGMAINEELTQAYRDILEMEVPPALVYNKVKSSSIYKSIRHEQELRLVNAKNDGYKDFDITLLYTLIRNICTKVPLPTKGWGGNTMPAVGEITIGDDIERIRLIRNNMFGHISSASTSQTEFDDTWSIIYDVCQRLQTYTKKNYLSGLSNIQRQALEEENEKVVIEKLEADFKNNKELMEMMFSLNLHLQEMKMESESKEKENTLRDEILENWREENIAFVSTRASGVVEEKFKCQNLVTVVGNSGSGKSAIIQHIALKYKEQGGNVIPVDKVEEIKEIYSRGILSENMTLFVLNDPLGKESLDEIAYNSWKTYQKTLEVCLKKVKLLVSCRRCVLHDKRVKGILLEESAIVEIDNEENGLIEKEKRAIFNQYSQNLKLSEEIVAEIIKTNAYFPLLCKLFSKESNYKEKWYDFFNFPFKFIKQEIEVWKKADKKKFCALILIVAFQNNLKIDIIPKSENSKKKYNEILGMCELQENTHISVIRSTLRELKGSYVKCVGHAFQFLHDFIMEITTLVFGVDCPQETIQYADSGFLRRRMKIEDDTEEEDRDPFTVYLPEEYIDDLVGRFIIDIQSEHFMDVLLNPCFRKESVIEKFKGRMKSPENLHTLSFAIKWEKGRIEFQKAFEYFHFSRLAFLYMKDDICPVIGLIIFCHNDLSSFFLNSILQTTLNEYPLFFAVCANGDLNLLNYVSQEYKKTAIKEMWDEFSPIHIASVFHNFSIIEELIRLGADVNMLTNNDRWTPLLLAASNDEEHLKEAGRETEEGERRNETILCLLYNGANINLCNEIGASPLWVACQNGHDSTVQLLLNKGADINLCENNGVSPLFKACHNGYESTVQLLLKNGADINLCKKDGVSPLYITCHNGHESMVQLLLNNGADINLCNKDGVSSLYIACENGYESTVKLLLNNGADINLCDKNGINPLHIAGHNGHESTVQLLLNNGADINACDNYGISLLIIAGHNGHDSMVQLLLNKGADINLLSKNGISPLYAACQNGHNSTVQLLLNKSADINLCDNDGLSPLYIASQNGHDSTVKLLLNNGADVNFCENDGFSPLFIACQNGHDSTVQLLLNSGADINLCANDGFSPLYIACQNGHDSTVRLLLNNGACINLCNRDGISPLFISCQNGHDSTVQLLLNNGADINLCNKDGISPLYIACFQEHYSTVQLLLNKGADINLCDNDGFSPLHIACQNRQDSMIQLLLNNGADITLCNKNGASPLYMACENGHDNTVQLLLKNGADITL